MGSIRQRKWSYNSRKINKTKFIAKDFTNGDTAKKITQEVVFPLQKPKQMEWESKERTVILLKNTRTQRRYLISQQLRNIYNNNTDKAVAITKLAHWYNNMKNLRIKKALLYNDY
jgi:hypothetical protein